MKINQISLIGATATFATLLTTFPAKAIIYDWQFTNDDGSYGTNNEIVRGEVEFLDADVFPNANNVSATSLTITGVDNLSDPNPFFGDGGIELNTNLIGSSNVTNNSFSFDGLRDIATYSFEAETIRDEGVFIEFSRDTETLSLSNSGMSLTNSDRECVDFAVGFASSFDECNAFFGSTDNTVAMSDSDVSSVSFQQPTSASVPFEFSPTVGLFLVGGVFGGKRYLKHRQANK